MILWLLTNAAAGELDSSSFSQKTLAGHPVMDLRIGAQSVDGKHPYLCGEVNPLGVLGLEACGNGAGTLHNDDTPDMMHIRLRGRALQHQSGRVDANLLVGAGITEVTRTRDQIGLKFGKAQEPQPVEAAGGELSISGKARYFLTPGSYAVGDVNVGGAYVPGAPAVFGRGGPFVPFATVTVGLGF